MNLAEWRASRKRTKTVTLPSGLEVVVQPVSMQAFLRANIPDTLTPIVASLFETGQMPPAKSVKDYRAFFELLDAVAVCAIVEPKVVDGEPGEGELSVDELTEGDKSALLQLLGVTAKAFEDFRPPTESDVVAVLSGEGDEPAAE